MLVKVEEVIEIKKHGFSSMIRVEKMPEVGSFLGPHKILDVSKIFSCCFICTCKGGHKDKFLLLTNTPPTVGEELELK